MHPSARAVLGLLLTAATVATSVPEAVARPALEPGTPLRPVPAAAGCASFAPASGATWEVVASEHFCVHYRPTLSAVNGGATTTRAQTVLTELDKVYAAEVDGLGYTPPVADADGLVDVVLDETTDGGEPTGFCAPDGDGPTSTGWCQVDNDFAGASSPTAALRTALAHVFFYVVQLGYDRHEEYWLMNGTAAWMEDRVYPGASEFLGGYLRSSQVVHPRHSLDDNDLFGVERFGAVTFWKFLAERYRDPGIIREVWTAASVAGGNRTALQAVAAVLKARGSSLPVEFARYGVWNTLPPGSYADRARFPAPGVWATRTLTKRKRDTGTLAVLVDHLATAPLVLRPASTLGPRTRVRITVDGPGTARGSQARLQVRYRSGAVTFLVVALDARGRGTRAVTFNPRKVRSVVLTMSNGSTVHDAQRFAVRAVARS